MDNVVHITMIKQEIGDPKIRIEAGTWARSDDAADMIADFWRFYVTGDTNAFLPGNNLTEEQVNALYKAGHRLFCLYDQYETFLVMINDKPEYIEPLYINENNKKKADILYELISDLNIDCCNLKRGEPLSVDDMMYTVNFWREQAAKLC